MKLNELAGKKVHMIGIGGSSMSGLAEMLLHSGIPVSGSDGMTSHAVDRLREEGIPVTVGHRKENVHGADLIVYSAAIAQDNPERMEASALHIPQMERAELLGMLMEGYRDRICICGTHGKTTTSAMIAKALVDLEQDPTVHIGGRLDAIGGNSRMGSRRWFVAEACEYHSSFLFMNPTVALITNIQEDHLDYYKDIDDIQNAFARFFSLLPPDGIAVGWGDDKRILEVFSHLPQRHLTYGLNESCDYRAVHIVYSDLGHPSCDILYHDEKLSSLSLQVVGEHNLLDALGAFALLHSIGCEPEGIVQSLAEFTGAHRRFEYTGTVDGVRLYHDYGHNPAEMATAVHSARLQHPRRVWAVMQPHTYSRVKRLYQDYLTCTREADFTLVTDIFAAREKDPGDINSSMLVRDMKANGINALLTPGFDDTENYLRSHWLEGDLVITMSCGNINLLNEQIIAHGDTTESCRSTKDP